MLRPVGMSHASLIFLKSDVEEAMQTLNSYGAFHLSTKGVEGQSAGDLIERAQELYNRVNDLAGRAASVTGESAPSSDRGPPIISNEWASLFDKIESELVPYEKEVRSAETTLKVRSQLLPLLQTWKAISSELEGVSGLGSLPDFRRIRLIFLTTKGATKVNHPLQLPQEALVVHKFVATPVYLVACRSADEAKVLHAAEDLGLRPLERIEGMPDRLGDLAQFISRFESEFNSEANKLTQPLNSIASIRPRLDYFSSILSDANAVLDIRNKSALEKNWAMIEGYVPTKKVEPLNKALSEGLNGRFIPFVKAEKDAPKTPVAFNYPKGLRIFDKITNLYGTPSYNEINPTPILTLTFPIFFGLMFGDLGHGILLACIGAFMYKKVRSMRSIGHVLIITGITAALMGGLLYGEVFGKSLATLVGYTAPLHVPEGEAAFMSYIMQIFKLALFIGIGQISLGLILSITNNVIQRKWSEIILVNVPKVAFYWALMYVVFSTSLDILSWFNGPIYLILAPVVFLLLASPVYAMIKHGGRAGLGHLGETGFDLFETAISFTSNTVSYLRIFAMIIAHIELMAVFYSLAGIVSGGIVGIIFSGLIIVVGNVFVTLLEGVIALAQDLRLHFYEWFSKFYQDSGIRFSPFKLNLGVPIKNARH